MADLASVSGGRTFDAAELRDAKAAFAEVAKEIGTQYSIGYYPVNFFFNDPATTKIYTLSLHDALPISNFGKRSVGIDLKAPEGRDLFLALVPQFEIGEHTSELQSLAYLVCRLLLE